MSDNKLTKVLFFISILISFASLGQTDTVNTTLVINSDTTVNNLVNNDTIIVNNGALTISGNFVNHGVIINNDSIIIAGNWIDSTTDIQVIGGRVVFNGTSPQLLYILGDDIFKNLTLSGDTVTLNGTAVIQNLFNLQTIIKTTIAGDTLLLDSAAIIINASSSSYVDGALFRRERDNSFANDTLLFPLGNANGNYSPIKLNNFAAGAGAKKAIIRIIALSNLPSGATATPGYFLYGSTYWKMTVVSGSYSSGSKATLYYPPSDVGGASPSTLSVAESNSSSGNFINLGSSAFTSNSVTTKFPVTFNPGITTLYLALEGNSPVCSFSYTRTADTSVCGSSFSDTLKVNYALGADSISWAGGPYTNNPTYPISNLTTSKIIYFTLKSTTAPNCFKTDSVSIIVGAANASWTVADNYVCESNPALQLTPVEPGGIFQGTGVTNNSGNWYFNPSTAGAFKITYKVCSVSSSDTITVNAGPCETTIVSDNGGGSLVATPQGIFTTCDGTIYFLNYTGNTIYKVGPSGNVTMLAGPADGLNGPEGIAVNQNTGDVYFCDAGNNQIKKIDGTTGAITIIAGSGAQTTVATASSSDNTNGLAATFKNPGGIVIDFAGQYLYVADSYAYRIARISLSGTDTVITYAGQGIKNQATSTSDTLPSTRLQQEFGVTGQLAIDEKNNLYIPDFTVEAVKIVKYSVDSVETLVTSQSGLFTPIAVAVNGDGDVYIADEFKCTIYDFTNGKLNAIIGSPTTCGSSNPDYLSYPSGLSFNAKGYIDVADTKNNAIKRFTLPPWSPFINFKGEFCINSPKDSLIPKYPGGYYIASPADSSVSKVGGQWYFNPKIAGVGTQKLGYVYTMETCTDTLFTTAIVRPLPKPNIGTDTTLCSYQLGVFQLNAGGPYSNYKWYDNFNLTSDTTQFYTATDSGTYYALVTDTSKAKCMGYSDTVHIKSQAVPQVTLAQPVSGNLCAGDTTPIILTPQVSFGTIVRVLWQDSTVSSSYQAKGSGVYISTVTINLGSIQCNNTDTTDIQYKLDPQVSIISYPIAKNCNNYVFTADSIPTPVGGVAPALKGIARDSKGNLYVTDAANDVLWKITPGGTAYIYAGQLGVSISTGTDTNNATFSIPFGIAIDNYNGDIYISEQGTNIIRKITSSGQVSKFAGVIGSGGYTGPGFKDTTQFNMPSGLVITSAGDLYVADKGNNLIRKITPTGSVTNIGVASDYNAPVAITAMKNGNLLVGSGSGTILMVNPFSNDSVTTYATVSGGITGMVTDNTGRLYTSNTSSFIINNINIDGTITTEAGSGTSGYQNGLASVAKFSQLGGMYMPGRGLPLYVTDGNYIRKIVDSCSVSICDSISLSSSPQNFTSYTWSQGAATISSSDSITVSPGVYALTVIGNNQCPGSDTLLVKQLPKPTSHNPKPVAECIGDSSIIGPATLPNYKYVWTDGNTGGAPLGLSNDFIAQPVAKPTQQVTKYVLTITDTLSGCFNRDTVSFFIAISQVYAGSDTSFCQGDSVQIGSIEDTINTTLAWSPSNGISDTSIATPYVGGYLKAGVHMYIITANYINPFTHATCKYSDTVNVTADSTPVAIFTASALCIPDTAVLKDVSHTQDSIIQRQWLFGDGASATSANSTISHYYSLIPSGSVELTVTTSKGCIADTVVPAASLSFYPIPHAGISYKEACVGLPTQFNDASTVSPGTIVSWKWNINNGADTIIQTQDTTIKYTYSGSGTSYNASLLIQTSIGCKADTTIQVNLHNAPTAAITPAKSCTSDSTPFSGSATGVDLKFKWYFGDGSPSSNLMNPKHKYASSGNYSAALVVTDTSSFCIDSVSQNVVIATGPTVGFTTSNVCIGDSVVFMNTSSSPVSTLTYLWNFGDATTSSNQNVSHKFPGSGPYDVQLTVTDTLGCVGVSLDTLSLNTPPNSAVNYNKALTCNGDTVTLALQSQVPGESIVWKEEGQVLATNQDSIKVSQSGTYSLIITGINGCIDSSSTPLFFAIAPDTVKINIVPDTTVCLGDTVILKGYSNGDSLSFLWSSSGSGILGNSSTINASYTPLHPDSNFVVVTFSSSNKCAAASTSAKIYINPIPYPSFTYSPNPALVNDSILFVNTTDTASANIRHFSWNFGDYSGDSVNVFTPSAHAYADSGHYKVTLQATNKYDCKNTYIANIIIINSRIIYIPNIFTPTNIAANSENRVCKVYGVDIATSGFSFNIYDRWGSIVFSTTDFVQANTIGWDGRNQNGGDIVAQMGVYTYVVEGKYQDGTSFKKVGTVTLAQ